jgi:hypothetical protein
MLITVTTVIAGAGTSVVFENRRYCERTVIEQDIRRHGSSGHVRPKWPFMEMRAAAQTNPL